MNDVLEVLSALANIASIVRFLLDLRRFLKSKEEDKQPVDDVVQTRKEPDGNQAPQSKHRAARAPVDKGRTLLMHC